MVLSDALRMTAVGVGIGILGAGLCGQLLRGFLFGVSAWDPQTVAIVAGLCTAVALGAAYSQARRASQVDPIVALRYE
jgi:ABC-type antimicrobial peptide transport system permease subunit